MTDVKIIKSMHDPVCLRASVGGTEKIGYYLNYRGPLKDIIEMLEKTVEAARKQLEEGEPPITSN